MKRFGITLLIVFALMTGLSLLPESKSGSVMTGIGNVVTPVVSAQSGPSDFYPSYSDVIWAINNYNAMQTDPNAFLTTMGISETGYSAYNGAEVYCLTGYDGYYNTFYVLFVD